MRPHQLNVTIPRGVRAGPAYSPGRAGRRGYRPGAAGRSVSGNEFHPHALYRVDQRDVYLDLPLAPWEAALGATLKVPTPTAAVDLKIPPKSVAGGKLRLKGRGIPGTTPGDFYVVLQLVLPEADSETSQAFYAQMAEQFKSFNPRAKLGV
jgi:curved DNA-binding protein